MTRKNVLNRQIIVKVDELTHDAFAEMANKSAYGSMSELGRKLITDSVENFDVNILSEKGKLLQRQIRRQRRLENELLLTGEYLQLQREYDSVLETDLIAFAKKFDLKYPPTTDDVDPIDFDPHLSRIMKTINLQCNGDSRTTLRDIQRANRSYSRDDLLNHMRKLRDHGRIVFPDSNNFRQVIVERIA